MIESVATSATTYSQNSTVSWRSTAARLGCIGRIGLRKDLRPLLILPSLLLLAGLAGVWLLSSCGIQHVIKWGTMLVSTALVLCGMRSRTPAAPSMRLLWSVLIMGFTLVVVALPWLGLGTHALSLCNAGGSIWLRIQYLLDVAVLLILMGIAMVASRATWSPPSLYSRGAVVCVLVIWLDKIGWVLWSTLRWCGAGTEEESTAGVHGALEVFYGFSKALLILSTCLNNVLLVLRIHAVEAAMDMDVSMLLPVTAGIYCAFLLFSELLCDELQAGWMKKPSIPVIQVSATDFASMLFPIFRSIAAIEAFASPLRSLQKEVARVSGAPQEQARWAAQRLRVELAAVLCMAFTELLKAWTQPFLADRSEEESLWFSAIGNLHDLSAAVGIAVLCGLLGSRSSRPPAPPAPPPSRCGTVSSAVDDGPQDDPQWMDTVAELASRGVRLRHLLDFLQLLVQGDVMPHFDAERSTTNDVVRHAIIPLSRFSEEEGAGGAALATVWNSGQPAFAEKMVTHQWGNIFVHLIAAVVADALGHFTYDKEVQLLKDSDGIDKVKDALHKHDALDTLYWICAFSINQHASICASHGPEPEEPLQRADWEVKRKDSVTGELLPLCTCQQCKIFNSRPVESELNKFDDMMAYLFHKVGGFTQVVAVDASFDLFTRAWCVAELVEAEMQQMPQRVILHSEASLLRHYDTLSHLDVGKCRASRAEDTELILSKIGDVGAFNSRLQWLVFGADGLFGKWASQMGSCALIGRLALRASLAQCPRAVTV